MREVTDMTVLKIADVFEFNVGLTKYIQDGWQPVDGIVKANREAFDIMMYSTVLVKYKTCHGNVPDTDVEPPKFD